MLHIGKRIKEVFDQQPKGHNATWLAIQLNCNRTNIYDIFRRPTIDTALLERLSRILDHDFFEDLSNDYHHHKD
ncbi:MAG: hypothetical protein HDR48_01900 [Bacteroides sp.]|nr:hypothetical protein [Bacteroides sp.]MBD5418772.1 hypothetical protein [Bacteroides sp.]